jgi:hypothetical protein
LRPKKLAVLAARERIEPALQRHDIAWEAALPTILSVKANMTLDSPEDIESILDAFLSTDRQSTASAPQQTPDKTPPKKGEFRLDVSSLPAELRRVHTIFFDASHPTNLRQVFKRVAKINVDVLSDASKLIRQVIHLVRKCLPPFPIIADVSRGIGLIAMDLDFKLRSLPFQLAKSLRRVLKVPIELIRFATSTRNLLRVLHEVMPSKERALPQRITGSEVPR